MKLTELSQKIKSKCKELGFDNCGIVKARKLTEYQDKFLQWLKNGYHAQMHYMARNIDKRLDPRLLLNNAKSIIVAIMNYNHPEKLKLKKYKISQYAWSIDYHFVIKRKLWQLLDFINSLLPTNGRAFVDSAPVMERIWANLAGLGWIGKNSLLITKKGSYFFIGELIVDIELAYDSPMIKSYCGSCTKCLDACPTNAIIKPYIVDANKCISYLTIEYKGDFNQDVNLYNWIFGCDICQQVCPWNNKAQFTSIPELQPLPQILNLTDEQLENLSKPEFKKIFRSTPVERTKYQGFMRNIKQNKNRPERS